MKENKVLITFIFILFALPIPVSLFSWIPTIMHLASFGEINPEGWEWLSHIIVMIPMLLAGTYSISYIVSLRYAIINRKITPITFLPLLHIVLLGAMLFVFLF